MENFTVVIFLLAVLLGLYALIDKLKLPHSVFLVLIGLAIGFVPFFPNLVLNPDVIFVAVLPPLLFDAASQTSWHEFKTNFRQISTLGISLVFFTMVAVAITAHYFIPGFTWPLSFLLGAIVSPPDAVASSSIIKGLGLNKKVISILEGESLINDASALIAYRYALAAIITGSFIFWKAGVQFLWIAGGGIGIGLLLGYVLIFLHRKIENYPVIETGLSLLTPFVSYLAAEQLHTSGILAVVTTGIIISWRSQEIFSYQSRMQTRVVWDTLIFLMNGFIFILIGLQLPGILKQLRGYSFSTLLVYGLVVSVATIIVRILWVFISASISSIVKKIRSGAEPSAEEATDSNFWKNVLVVSWTGTRGMVSMATALALPVVLSDGKPFNERSLIIFLCFVVIFVTLVVQGLSLPLLIRLLRIKKTENQDKEETQIQLYLVHNTLHFIEHDYYPQLEDVVRKKLVKKYEDEARRLTTEIGNLKENEARQKQRPATLSPMQEALVAIKQFQRDLLLQLHKEGKFSSMAITEVEKDLDIDELKLNQSLPKIE
ncbi:MAG: Na+/H+ antiporter [Candidatus Dadabacteria bacterium]